MSTIDQQQILLVMTTINDIDKGKLLARQIVNQQLAGCVNIVPGVTSVYHWQQELCEEQECLLVIKTVQSRFNQLSELILAQHPYATPEVIATPITAGSQEYLSWIIQASS